jgi:NTE family protein
LARFDRIALVLSGGGALGAYQAGAYAALEAAGIRPNWIAGSAIGAVNAALIAGNLPHERSFRLRQFWRELSRRVGLRGDIGLRGRLRAAAERAALRWRGGSLLSRENSAIPSAELGELILELVDFERINNGSVRLVLGATNLDTGAETFFDNDRHTLTIEHVLASTVLPGMAPVTIDGQRYRGGIVSVAPLDDARPADTLCFVIDGYDPVPGSRGGMSRSAREITALRRNHDLRRMIALLGERLPAGLRRDVEIRKCLAEGSEATMTILRLVHEGADAELSGKMADFSSAALTRRWQAGESDVGTSLTHPLWLAPPPRRLGVVVHELRGGVAARPR